MRRPRKAVNVVLPVVGVLLVLGSALLIEGLQARVLITLVGILFVEAGVWKLADPFLPSERRYLALRAEVDGFIGLVRQLNDAALALRRNSSEEAREARDAVRRAMLESVERMVELAGKTEEDLAREAAQKA